MSFRKGRCFLTAQIAGHEVVCSVILPQPELPYSREGVENHFEHGADFGSRPRAKLAHYQKYQCHGLRREQRFLLLENRARLDSKSRERTAFEAAKKAPLLIAVLAL
jgi:hypothetical protein